MESLSSSSSKQSFRRAKLNLFPRESDRFQDGIKSISDLIAFNARENPSRLFCLQGQRDSDTISISFSQLEEAVQTCCLWLLECVSHEDSVSRPSVAIFLDTDIVIFIYIAAILRCNLQCVLLSARLSSRGIRHLLGSTSSKIVITSARLQDILQDAQAGQTDDELPFTPVVRLALPLTQLLPIDGHTKYDRPKLVEALQHTSKWTPAQEDLIFYLHSSGSTGLPKPIGLANFYLLGYAACHEFPNDTDESQAGITLSTMPLFHGFGLLAPCLALSTGRAFLLPPLAVVPGAPLVQSLLAREDVTALMTVPSILEDMLATIKDWQVMEKLDFVAVGGGALKQATGIVLSNKGINLLNHFGATEIGALAPIFRPDKQYDWRYLRVRQDLQLKIREKGTSSQGTRVVQLSGHPFGWNHSFELQDHMEANPLSDRLEVRILGRLDDIVVLATGEKVLPTTFERGLAESDVIAAAVVFGEGCHQLGVIIEPTPSARSICGERLHENLWALVEQQNKHADAHARIVAKDAMIILKDKESLPRSDKGSVQRKEVWRCFQDKIARVYAQLEDKDETLESLELNGQDIVADVTRIAAACVRASRTRKLAIDTDLMEFGMDSLGLIQYRRLLQGYIKSNPQITFLAKQVTLDFVYAHPSIADVATVLLGSGSTSADTSEHLQDYVQRLALHHTTQLCNELNIAKIARSAVLLTGATGSLGAHLLANLTKRTDLSSIVCLVRVQDDGSDEAKVDAQSIAHKRLVSCLESQSVSMQDEQWARVRTFPWEPDQERLGLTQQQYDDLLVNITHIFHGAWPMNFNRKVTSFSPHIKATASLVQLAKEIHGLRPYCVPRMVFVSSIATVGCLSGTDAPCVVPERPVAVDAALPMGYAKAKWICETILNHVGQRLKGHVELCTVRVGQLSGSETSAHWNSAEHIARLINASNSVKCLPRLSGTVSWLPVDRASHVMSEILIDVPVAEPLYHVENPVRQPYSAILEALKYQSSLTEATFEEYQDWLSKAKPYLDGLTTFFEQHFVQMATGSLVLDTTKARAASASLRSSGAVGLEIVRSYVRVWERSGVLGNKGNDSE